MSKHNDGQRLADELVNELKKSEYSKRTELFDEILAQLQRDEKQFRLSAIKKMQDLESMRGCNVFVKRYNDNGSLP